ncbi:MAG TPA: AMP-binding protein [Acidimicrobiales bacterium]|nr:AMP-binding protein [Acidimicrobiales bacterium]
MHPGIHAASHPDKPAYVMAATDGGEDIVVSYRELDDDSNRLARMLRDRGLQPGDSIAFLMENRHELLKIAWAAQRSGLYYTAISTRLTADEAGYILDDCGARAFFTTPAQATAGPLREIVPNLQHWFAVGGDMTGYEPYADAVAGHPAEPLPSETEGADMLYSSGTTGRPKGVKSPLTGAALGADVRISAVAKVLYGFDEDAIYLSPAPLYHAAPLRFTMGVHRLGATAIVMDHFDPRLTLELIERHRVTHAQFVPTMFVRMLKMPEEERAAYDVSSLRAAIHAAAPCPIPVKEQMIEWWGPVLHEYYAGTEGNGFCAIDAATWLEHKGSVGRPLTAVIHVVDDDGNEVPTGEQGTIYFESDVKFEYHNDPEKTAAGRHPNGWTTLGDIGYVDADGFLYLTDRKANMIISGGVNIYPQETENLLTMHPAVMDVAVFGVPDDDFGEQVKAVVQPVDPAAAGPELEAELIAWCRERLAAFKCPRSIDFAAELPRHPTGKLYKRLLRDPYWEGRATRI